ncbi:GNAT family N-acetyltransferase [Thalassotalea sp. PLHSN55]|uniref:GNAT family N-acetyltransferase n=1 Tax=Thalassotalea sp. PLHSN55 TaxID=3435888 RepID=UPI003F848717
MYTVKVITTKAELLTLKASWLLLERQQASDTSQCFISWQWLTLWLDTYQDIVEELRVITVYHQQECIAIAPFYCRNKHVFAKKELAFIGTNEDEEAEVASELLDIVCLTQYKSDVSKLIAKQLIAFTDLSGFNFVDISKQSLIYSVCALMKNQMLSAQEANAGWQFYLTTTQNDEFTAKLLHKKKRIINRFYRQENANFIIATNLAQALALFDDLVQLHQQRWQGKQKLGVFANPDFYAFHKKIIEQSFNDNESQLHAVISAVSVDNQTIAVNYSLKYRNKLYFYQSGINEYFQPNLSPGLLNHLLLVQYCQTAQITQYNLLKSASQNDYKKNISQLGLEVLSIKMLPFSNLNKLMLACASIKTQMRKLLKNSHKNKP